MSPAASRVLTHRPAEFAFERFGAIANEEGADRLRRLLERHVIRIDLHFGQHRRHVTGDSDALQPIADGLLQHESDRAFGLRHRDVE